MDLDLGGLLRLVRRWWWLLLAAPVVAAIAAYTLSSRQPAVYFASATIRIDPTKGAPTSDSDVLSGAEDLAQTYRFLIKTSAVLRPVVDQLRLPLDLDELKDDIETSVIQDTGLLVVGVSTNDPQNAATVANAVANEFVDYIARQEGGSYRAELGFLLAETERQIAETSGQVRALERAGSPASVQGEMDRLRIVLARLEDSYRELLAAARERDLADAAVKDQVRVVDPATAPDAPYEPRVALMTLLAIVVGLAIGMAAVVLIEFRENAVQPATDISRQQARGPTRRRQAVPVNPTRHRSAAERLRPRRQTDAAAARRAPGLGRKNPIDAPSDPERPGVAQPS